jgi:hypothetical protein
MEGCIGKWDCTRREATRHSMGPDLAFGIWHLSFVSGEVGILASLRNWSIYAHDLGALASTLGQRKRVFRPEWGSNN